MLGWRKHSWNQDCQEKYQEPQICRWHHPYGRKRRRTKEPLDERVLSKAFSASIEIIIWFLFFSLLMWCITLIDLWILKNPCIPGIKPTWSWCMIFLICCWILFARILLRIFTSMFIILACSVLFLWHLCLVLVLGWWWTHRMSLAAYLPLQFSGRVWVR